MAPFPDSPTGTNWALAVSLSAITVEQPQRLSGTPLRTADQRQRLEGGDAKARHRYLISSVPYRHAATLTEPDWLGRR